MPVRVAFDLDGVLADFAGAYDRIADGLFPNRRRHGAPRVEAAPVDGQLFDASAAGEAGRGVPPAPGGPQRRATRRQQRAVWKRIESTPDFWRTLDPVDPDAVRNLQERASRLGWETFFVTQRPPTPGDTVQRQTQRWLVEQGFALPSVVVHSGSRGRLAAALELDFLVDDTVEHCVDTLSESTATPILVDATPDDATGVNARRLGIEVCPGPGASLDQIERAGASRTLRSIVQGARRRLGW